MSSSGVLFKLARTAYERTVNEKGELDGGQMDALVSVVFSVCTLEALAMDLQLYATPFGPEAVVPHSIRELADILDEAEESKGSVTLKYLLAKAVLPGEPFDKGAKPFQDFALLVRLRNDVVHMKPHVIKEEPTKIVAQLAQRDLCHPWDHMQVSSWVASVSTRAIARWACNVVVDMVEVIGKAIPQSQTPSCFLDMASWGWDYQRVT